MPKISHRRGELLALSSGGASSYECSGLYRVLNDLSLGDLAEQYCRQTPYRERTLEALNKGLLSIEEITLLEAQGIYNHRDAQGFGHYLISRGYVQLVMIHEVHCGAGFSPDLVRESAEARANTLEQLQQGSA
jgi:hypothetical protein